MGAEDWRAQVMHFMRGAGAAEEGSAPAWAMEAAGGGRVARVNRGPDQDVPARSAGVSLNAYPTGIGGVPKGYTDWDTHISSLRP